MKSGKKSESFKGPSFARAVAFQVIYEREANPETSELLDEELIEREFALVGDTVGSDHPVVAEELAAEDEEDSILSVTNAPLNPLSFIEVTELTLFVRNLIDAVCTHRGEIDERIAEASHNWRLDRMSATDRNLVRMATAEILYLGTPAPIVINEAINLGKNFGSANSASFINGVLGQIVREIEGAK